MLFSPLPYSLPPSSSPSPTFASCYPFPSSSSPPPPDSRSSPFCICTPRLVLPGGFHFFRDMQLRSLVGVASPPSTTAAPSIAPPLKLTPPNGPTDPPPCLARGKEDHGGHIQGWAPIVLCLHPILVLPHLPLLLCLPLYITLFRTTTCASSPSLLPRHRTPMHCQLTANHDGAALSLSIQAPALAPFFCMQLVEVNGPRQLQMRYVLLVRRLVNMAITAMECLKDAVRELPRRLKCEVAPSPFPPPSPCPLSVSNRPPPPPPPMLDFSFSSSLSPPLVQDDMLRHGWFPEILCGLQTWVWPFTSSLSPLCPPSVFSSMSRISRCTSVSCFLGPMQRLSSGEYSRVCGRGVALRCAAG